MLPDFDPSDLSKSIKVEVDLDTLPEPKWLEKSEKKLSNYLEMHMGSLEIVPRFKMEGVQNNFTFYTDSNGLYMMKRVY